MMSKTLVTLNQNLNMIKIAHPPHAGLISIDAFE